MIRIILYHNPENKRCKILEHYEENWKSETITETEKDEDGQEILDEKGEPRTFTYQKGLHPDLAAVKLVKVQIGKGAQRVEIVDTVNHTKPLFTLNGHKALQLNVLETALRGILKNRS